MLSRWRAKNEEGGETRRERGSSAAVAQTASGNRWRCFYKDNIVSIELQQSRGSGAQQKNTHQPTGSRLVISRRQVFWGVLKVLTGVECVSLFPNFLLLWLFCSMMAFGLVAAFVDFCVHVLLLFSSSHCLSVPDNVVLVLGALVFVCWPAKTHAVFIAIDHPPITTFRDSGCFPSSASLARLACGPTWTCGGRRDKRCQRPVFETTLHRRSPPHHQCILTSDALESEGAARTHSSRNCTQHLPHKCT